MMHIVPATREHLEAIAADIRDYDAFELKIFTGRSGVDGLEFIQRNASKLQVLEYDGKPAVMFGHNVTDMLFKVACPFLIITKYAESRPILFVRYSKAVLAEMHGYYLVNYVQARNQLAIKWLEWLGFYVAPPELYQEVTMVRRFSKDCR